MKRGKGDSGGGERSRPWMPPAMGTVTGREASANRCRQDSGDGEGTAGTNNKKPSAGFSKVVHDRVLKTSGSSVGQGGHRPTRKSSRGQCVQRH